MEAAMVDWGYWDNGKCNGSYYGTLELIRGRVWYRASCLRVGGQEKFHVQRGIPALCMVGSSCDDCWVLWSTRLHQSFKSEIQGTRFL